MQPPLSWAPRTRPHAPGAALGMQMFAPPGVSFRAPAGGGPGQWAGHWLQEACSGRAQGAGRGDVGSRGRPRPFPRRVPIPGGSEDAGTQTRSGASPGNSARDLPEPQLGLALGGIERGPRQAANCDSAGEGERNTKALI